MNYNSVFLLVVLLFLFDLPLSAQEIRLEEGDRIDLIVPGRPGLERRLLVDSHGRISIPVIGELAVSGMTIQEVEALVLARIQGLYPSVKTISIVLVGEESRRLIYIHGEVLNPGKYEFKSNPSVWEAVREAGGATALASLETVRIIRAGEEGRRTLIVNLQEVLENGNFDSLPELRPGDTVIIPAASVQYTGDGSVRVIGSVVRPGSYKITGDKTLTDAILAAGGPESNADLKKVNIIRHLVDGKVITIQVDFGKYLNNGDSRQNPVILPDDTVNIPRDNNTLRVLVTDPRYLIGLLTASATLFAIFNR
ncbi:MAG: SLBB domain-containing protein [Candidatus Krumholzibacteriota bacterium]|nr:SLBB domain-containing protein [Candidatus Krumholzibacteriota bacterium]